MPQRVLCTKGLMDIAIAQQIEPIIPRRSKSAKGGVLYSSLWTNMGEKKTSQIQPTLPVLVRFDTHTVTPTRRDNSRFDSTRSFHRASIATAESAYHFLLETGMLPSKISFSARLAPHSAKSLTTTTALSLIHNLSSPKALSHSFRRLQHPYQFQSHERPKQAYTSKRTPKD